MLVVAGMTFVVGLQVLAAMVASGADQRGAADSD